MKTEIKAKIAIILEGIGIFSLIEIGCSYMTNANEILSNVGALCIAIGIYLIVTIQRSNKESFMIMDKKEEIPIPTTQDNVQTPTHFVQINYYDHKKQISKWISIPKDDYQFTEIGQCCNFNVHKQGFLYSSITKIQYLKKENPNESNTIKFSSSNRAN